MAFADPQTNIEALGLELGMKVADIGAGIGAYAFAAARKVGSNGRIYAIDVQHELLAKLKGEARKLHIENIETVWADIEMRNGTKLRDALVDAVIVSNILFQVGEKRGLVGEVKRILRKDGRVLVIDWAESFGGLGPAPKDVYKKEEARALFIGEGFQFITEFDAGDHHYGLVLTKK